MAKRSTKKRSASPRAPKSNAQAKEVEEAEVSNEIVSAPPLDPAPPVPDGYEVDDRVVIPDMGHRHGVVEQVDSANGLLLVKLDGFILHPADPSKKVNRIEIEQDRCRVCRGSRGSAAA